MSIEQIIEDRITAISNYLTGGCADDIEMIAKLTELRLIIKLNENATRSPALGKRKAVATPMGGAV